MQKKLRRLLVPLIWLFLGLVTLWSAAAIYFDVRCAWLRLPLAALYGVGHAGDLDICSPPWKAMVHGGAGLSRSFWRWWFSLQPSNKRDWQPDRGGAALRGNQRQPGHPP